MVQLKRRYSLDELLAACSPARAPSAEEQAWIDLIPVGLEDEEFRVQLGASSVPSVGKASECKSR